MRDIPRTCIASAILAVVLGSGPPTRAQVASDPTDLLNPSTLSFEHDGRNVKGFAVYITQNGTVVQRVDLGALRPDRNGKLVASVPVLPQGTYSIAVAAYNEAGESARVRAEPSIFRVTQSAATGTDSAGDVTGLKPNLEPKAPDKPDSKPKKGIFGKVFRVVVGSDDDPESPQK